MKILVTGGAGYIGSFMVKTLLDRGDEVVVFDSLERGRKEAVDTRARLVEGDIKDRLALEKLFKEHKFDAIMHFAGFISVEESTKNPDLYYQNNVVGSKNLFEIGISVGNVNKIIFSSSAAVYGNPTKVPIPEDHPKNPTSEYGKNKLAVEEILKDLRNINPQISFTCLRYFNACGAALDGNSGEMHVPETHIIPLAIKAIMEGKEFSLFGTDYETIDGTCVRDYIHVLDLVEAHILVLKRISESNGGLYYNVGTGNGFSNKQILEEIEKVSNKKLNILEKPRRAGDSDELVADSTNIRWELGFDPKYSSLETIIKSAWEWHKKQN
ncbi:MAG: UDP-glucose 4-epimerase GalE [Candidatus Levybacteria bacterium]|nr:UDP-glucose 4-epimerase GalE [Candidatus Levybacteria bacterium]